MGLLDDAYDWVDRNIAGGFLPGGELSLGVPLVGAVERVAGQFAPGPQLPSGFQPAAVVAPGAVPAAGGLFGAGAAGQAAAGMPVTFPSGPQMPRGKTITAVAVMMPNGQIIPRKILPGRPVVMSSDIAAVKRMKKAKRVLDRQFPKARKKRRSYRARRSSSHNSK